MFVIMCCQRAHIPKAIMSVLEKDTNEQQAVEKARRVEEERLTQQEKLYQVYTYIMSTQAEKFQLCFNVW